MKPQESKFRIRPKLFVITYGEPVTHFTHFSVMMRHDEVHYAKSLWFRCNVQANPQHKATVNLFRSITQTPVRVFFSLLILKHTKNCLKNNLPRPQGVNP